MDSYNEVPETPEHGGGLAGSLCEAACDTLTALLKELCPQLTNTAEDCTSTPLTELPAGPSDSDIHNRALAPRALRVN